MSARFVMVPLWVLDNMELTDTDVRVYAMLANYSNKARIAFPTVATLADRAGKSTDTVRRSLHRLATAGAITAEACFSDTGVQLANVYVVRTDEPVAPVPPRTRSARATPASHTCQDEGGTDASLYKELDPIGTRGSANALPAELHLEGMAAEPESATVEAVREAVRELSSGQLAKALQSAWWEHVKRETGKYPIAVHPAGFVKLVTPFFDAGYTTQQLKRAVFDLHASGTTLTRASLERELQRPGASRVRRGRNTTVTDQLAQLRYDADGNVLD